MLGKCLTTELLPWIFCMFIFFLFEIQSHYTDRSCFEFVILPPLPTTVIIGMCHRAQQPASTNYPNFPGSLLRQTVREICSSFNS